MKYPKLQTYWKRHQKGSNKGKIIHGEITNEAFANIKLFSVSEKIDGTNTRIMLRGDKIIFGGRNYDENEEKFNQPKFLMKYLRETFTVDKLRTVFPDGDITLFGEGYGPKIQKGGGAYRDDVAFILFDVVVHGEDNTWWLERDNVNSVAKQLEINSVPMWDKLATFEEIEEWVKKQPISHLALQNGKDFKVSEGIVARAHPLVLLRNGKPLMFKLKVRDYE